MVRGLTVLFVLWFLATLPATTAEPIALVVCAPGYPGNTADAQPAMDRFAAALARHAGTGHGSLIAVYHEQEASGLARLRAPDAALALVPYALSVEHGEALGLVPHLQAVPAGSPSTETWTLVAKRGRVKAPGDLAGWELVSIAGYAPAFVGGKALAGWGPLPEDLRLTGSGQALSALRRAVVGQDVAVLLDGAQGRALTSLPFAAELETVATSAAFPVSVLCVRRGRERDRVVASTLEALRGLHESDDGRLVLQELRLDRFTALDSALATSRK